MEILGVCLTIISLIGAYLWRANGKLQRRIMEALVQIQEGQKEIAQGQKEIAQGQKEIAQGQKEIAQGQKEIAQMLLNQTKILERIEGKISSLS